MSFLGILLVLVLVVLVLRGERRRRPVSAGPWLGEAIEAAAWDRGERLSGL